MDGMRGWFFDELAAGLTAAFETAAGTRPAARWEPLVAPSETDSVRWRQGFEHATGAVWILAAPQAWTAAGNHLLRAAGTQAGDEGAVKSAYLDALSRAVHRLAQGISSRIGRETAAGAGGESGTGAEEASWARLHLEFEDVAWDLDAGVELALLDALSATSPPPAAVSAGGAAGSKTFELLLDVELPVSVSFGRAQVPLKDVIKLTTGSIVELNRSIAEPVEVIVNNCVIARGEVVVVEGNFGVRIQEVISQKERLRTLT